MINKIIIIVGLVIVFITGSIHAQNDLTLWYNNPASQWSEALPIGNGRLGAMIFGGVKQDRIQFNEETVWTGYPRDYNKNGAYQYLDPIRNLLFAGKQKEAEMLAGREFMGLKSKEGDRQAWLQKIMSVLTEKNNPSQKNYNDRSWKTMPVPNYDGWEAQGFEGMDGAVWFRKEFVLPKSWNGKDLKLDINKISEADYTYVNGTLIGSQLSADVRDYTIPATTLKKGKNMIAILVINYSGKGGIMGYKDADKHIGLYPVGASESEKLSLNGNWKYFIQDENVPAIGQYQAAYQPFGDIFLNFNLDDAKIANYKRSLDLSNAIAQTTYQLNGVNYKREYIASEPAQAIAIHLSADKMGSINFEAALSSPHRNHQIQRVDANTISISIEVKDGAIKGVAFLQVKQINGIISVKNNKLIIANADEATLYLTAATNYNNYKDISKNALQAATISANALKNTSWNNIVKEHTKEYQQYFNTFRINFFNNKQKEENALLPTDERLVRFANANDPSFVALYLQYGRYLLISSSRPGTRPANLQGIWNELLSPPWGSKYTVNINTEMNYWPAEILNLSPMHYSLFSMIKDVSETGKETAKQYYNTPGWVLHHNTDLWRGTAAINASNHGIWVTGGAWLCNHLWEHYLFTQDKNFLRDTAYPIMKGASEFFNNFLIKDPVSGYLISTPSNSPENGGLVAGPTMDHQIIRTLFKNTIEASQILNVDATFRKELKNKYIHIAPNRIGRYGQLQEWMQDVDDTSNKHRHVSHLWAVYPGNEINWNQSPQLMQAARQSLIYRGDAATGWSLGWKINLWARFKDGNHVYKLIKMLLYPAGRGAGSYPNLFDAHPPFQIDGNFGGAAGIAEMLIQSQNGYIDVLPALPDALPNGDIKGMKARGGFELDMSWRNGELTSLTIQSNAGQPLIVRYKDKEIKLNTVKNNVYKFNGLLQKK
ncbi:MAG: glycosyl hydrolase family 95 catalytic domain-containing protein [Niabella sp.]